MLTGQILITGGSGTMGRAIIKRATEEKWDCRFIVFSTDAMKHVKLRSQYPNVQCVVGDIRDYRALLNVMTGKDYCLHLAAVKHIPVSEYDSIDTYDVNVNGSLNICMAAMQLGTPHVLGISTDKSCHPANAYGATKMLMEKVFQEYSRLGLPTQFHLVRMGNVLESTGSVIEAWKKAIERGEPIRMTDPEMTRFWLSPSQAVKFLIEGMNVPPGCIYIPKVPALSIGKLAEYALNSLVDRAVERVPLRPGEKMHETLLTLEETWYTATWDRDNQEGYVLRPTTSARNDIPSGSPYTSDMTRQLTQTELLELLND